MRVPSDQHRPNLKIGSFSAAGGHLWQANSRTKLFEKIGVRVHTQLLRSFQTLSVSFATTMSIGRLSQAVSNPCELEVPSIEKSLVKRSIIVTHSRGSPP